MSGLKDVKLHVLETFTEACDLEAWFTAGPLQHGVMAVDTETTGLVIGEDQVRTVQVGDGKQGWCLPWTGWSGMFTDMMRRFNGTVLMHNAPFDQGHIKAMGHTIPWHQISDTRVKAHIVDPSLRTGLKWQAARLVDPAAGTAQKELDAAIKKFGWGGVSLNFPPFWQYAALDPVLTFLLNEKLSELLAAREDQAFGVENGVLQVLSRMMENRVPVDTFHAAEHYAKFLKYCEQVHTWCMDEYGVSPGSNQGVVKVLQEAGFEFTKDTANGAVALDKEVLEGINHPLAVQVLKRRQVQKLATTYLKHFMEESRGGFIRASINSLGARTGRMSVSEPNLQNLPRVSEGVAAANVVRDTIAAKEGMALMFCDFAQVETRLLAHLSQDAGLIAAFHSDEDFFVTLARQVFQDETLHKKSPQRNVIKTMVYALIYGAGVEKIAKGLNASVAYTGQVYNTLMQTFPGIKVFQNATTAQAHRNGYVVCPLSGRRHPVDKGKEYAGVNYLIQGMAAFFFKMKLLELSAAGLDEYMILPVHDEVILHLPIEKIEWAGEILTAVMNDASMFSVPIQAEVSVGQRWGKKEAWTRAA